MPSIYRKESRNYPYDASMENLAKAYASEKWHPPRPWRSKEEGLMIRRYVLLWLTCRDASRPSGRDWARQLGISHTSLQKVVRELRTDPSKIRRLEGYGYPTLEQLGRAQEHTRRMRERGELRSQRERKAHG
jgi:biotin operon repressor